MNSPQLAQLGRIALTHHLQSVLDLKIRLAHLHVGFGLVAARNHTAVVVAQHHNGYSRQVRTKHPLAAGVKAVAIDQSENRLGLGMAAHAVGDNTPDDQLITLEHIPGRVLWVLRKEDHLLPAPYA